MLLRQMRYFVTIVDCNSFTEAAEQMFISQSAISQQMKVLETELHRAVTEFARVYPVVSKVSV